MPPLHHGPVAKDGPMSRGIQLLGICPLASNTYVQCFHLSSMTLAQTWTTSVHKHCAPGAHQWELPTWDSQEMRVSLLM